MMSGGVQNSVLSLSDHVKSKIQVKGVGQECPTHTTPYWISDLSGL
jgi:hypothetical protein